MRFFTFSYCNYRDGSFIVSVGWWEHKMILKFALLYLCFAIFECGKSHQIIETRSTSKQYYSGQRRKRRELSRQLENRKKRSPFGCRTRWNCDFTVSVGWQDNQSNRYTEDLNHALPHKNHLRNFRRCLADCQLRTSNVCHMLRSGGKKQAAYVALFRKSS